MGPQSNVRSAGTLEQLTHSLWSALVQMEAEASAMGITSDHLVDLFAEVKSYLTPFDGGRGPTMLM